MPDPGRDIDQAVPIFVNCRDRVSCLRLLVDWLEGAGYERIYLLDNDSTFEPLLAYYERSPHRVIKLGANVGHLAPWTRAIIDEHADGPYVVTDPDVVPTEACPSDAVAFLLDLLGRYPDHCKAGLGLVIDDLPNRFAHAKYVRAWEAQHWRDELEPGVFDAPVDTTFAVYRAGTPFAKRPALRSGPPYVARHLPWYADSAHSTEEELYYRQHALESINTWNQKRLPDKLDGYFHRSPWDRARRRLRRLRSR